MVKQFYVYTYRDPNRDNEPIYVGKGHNKRYQDHFNRKDRHPFTHRLQKMKRNGIEPVIERIDVNNEAEAFELEMFLIEEIGRKDMGKGPLLNLTDGGDGISGYRFTADQREKQRTVMKETRNRPEIKEKWDDALRAVNSRPEVTSRRNSAIKDAYSRPDVKVRHKEAHNSEQFKLRAGTSRKEVWKRPEFKAKFSAAMKSRIPNNHPLYKGASPTGNLLKFFR
jgi:hypothetical protein